MRRAWALLLRYDGGPYKGWQPHPALPTVGGVLAAAMHRAGVRATPFGASRTDAGVHARAQVVSFRSREDLDPDLLLARLNADLPSTLRVLAVRPADASFHAHWSSTGKIYRYRLSFRGEPGAWRLPSERFPYASLDRTRLEAALRVLAAAPDVSALCAKGERANKARALRRAELLACDAAGALLEFEAGGFGKYLVRNLVGAALGAAVGAWALDEVERMAAGRASPPPRAEADGLSLHRVLYPAALDPFPDVDQLSFERFAPGSSGAPPPAGASSPAR